VLSWNLYVYSNSPIRWYKNDTRKTMKIKSKTSLEKREAKKEISELEKLRKMLDSVDTLIWLKINKIRAKHNIRTKAADYCGDIL